MGERLAAQRPRRGRYGLTVALVSTERLPARSVERIAT
jgi:hypothetical protein